MPAPRASACAPEPRATHLSVLATKLIAWQQVHGRHDLPWQRSRDPYRVWLSEIMLQQTQVSTVLAYYDRFLARFPDVAALAQAPLDAVLAAWSGLGYYRRARLLHQCAQVVMNEHGGEFPKGSAALAELPGIGRSTAAAIAAFCQGERAAILDGNVKRVLTRALGFGDDLAKPAAERQLWALAESLLPLQGIEAYTQGLMDLGATVCLQRKPHCLVCPLADDCVARREGDAARYPVKTRTLRRGRREHSLLWLVRDRHHWLVQRPDDGVWASLWSLPELDESDDLDTPAAWAADWQAQLDVLSPIEHVLTHFDWTLRPLRLRLPDGLDASTLRTVDQAVQARWPTGRWWSHDDALALGLPSPVRRLLTPA